MQVANHLIKIFLVRKFLNCIIKNKIYLEM